MNVHGILKTDDLITRFFRLSTQMCVDLCYRALSEQNNASPMIVRTKCFHTLDAFVRLIALLVKHSGDASNTATKVNLLNKVCFGFLELRRLYFQDPAFHVAGFGHRGRRPAAGPRGAPERFPAVALPPHLHHSVPGAEHSGASARSDQFPGAHRVLPHAAHTEADSRTRIRLCLARTRLAQSLHWPHARHYSSAEGNLI